MTMRRLITLLLGLAGVAAAVRIALRRRSGRQEPLSASVMPRPTAPPAAEDVPTPEPAPMPSYEPDPTPTGESPESATAGPLDEGEPGAITAAPVPEEPEPEPAPAPDDATLERAVESEIAEDPAVPAEDVEVEVEGRIAQLRGTVPDEETATRIGDDAARVDGVIGLDDQLERPSGEADEPGAAPRRDPEPSD